MLTDKQKIFLASSPAFNERLDEDPVMKQLDACRVDYARERELLFEAFGGTWNIGFPVSPITPAVWSILWSVKSPFVDGKNPVRVLDVAVFMRLLTHPLSEITLSTLEEDAKKEGASFGLPEDAENLAEELTKLVELAFAPLKMLPPAVADDEVLFDSDWLLSVCSVASREAGIPLQRAMVDLPLSVVFGLMVICARKANPGKHYTKKSPDWVSKQELERTNELAEEFIREFYKEEE